MRRGSGNGNSGTEKHRQDAAEKNAQKGQVYVDTELCKREETLEVVKCPLYEGQLKREV